MTRSHSCCVVFIYPKQADVSYVSRNSARILRFAAKHCQCNHEITFIVKCKHKNVVSHQKTSVRNGSDGKPNHNLGWTANKLGDAKRLSQMLTTGTGMRSWRSSGAAHSQVTGALVWMCKWNLDTHNIPCAHPN